MNHIVHYSSSRSEIWHWYWREWRRRLWPIHAASSIIVGFSLSGNSINPSDLIQWIAYSVAVFPIVVAVFASVPQIMFKSTERSLRIGPDGWSSIIGKKSGSRTWAEVAAVREEAGSVVISGTNGNALIIPPRAFSDETSRQQFLSDARLWHARHVAQQGSQADEP